jgi:HlyD family secretion protein
MKRRKKILKVASLVAVLAVLVGGGYATWAYATDGSDPAGALRTISVRRGELLEVASASGTIEPHVQVEVKSRASGEIVEVLVEEGDVVEEGQVLFRLDRADAQRAIEEARVAERRIRAEIVEARASLAISEADANQARVQADVSRRGRELGLVTEEADRAAQHGAEIALANVTLRRAQITAAQAQLDTARLSVEDAELRFTETEVHAPVAGTILSVDVEVGSIVASAVTNVSGGTALATLADLTDLRVIGQIDEAQIGRVEVAQKVIVRVDAYPDREFEGRVERVSPLGRAETNVVTFDVEIVVTDEHRDLLRSGMSADLEIETRRYDDALLVPLTAIRSEGGRRVVTLASGESRTVRTGPTDGMRIVVLEGLEENDRIVAENARPRAAGEGAGAERQNKSIIPMGGGGGGGGRRWR